MHIKAEAIFYDILAVVYLLMVIWFARVLLTSIKTLLVLESTKVALVQRVKEIDKEVFFFIYNSI